MSLDDHWMKQAERAQAKVGELYERLIACSGTVGTLRTELIVRPEDTERLLELVAQLGRELLGGPR